MNSIVEKLGRKLNINDLELNSSSISIPILTEKIVDDSICGWLEKKLYDLGHKVEFVNLDEMGYLYLINYNINGMRVNNITDKEINDVLNILNGEV